MRGWCGFIVLTTAFGFLAAHAAKLIEAAPAEVESKSAFCGSGHTMERYACLTEAAAKGAIADGLGMKDKPAYLALATVQIVQTLASSARYRAWMDDKRFALPTSARQEICLDEGFGICGNHMLLFV